MSFQAGIGSVGAAFGPSSGFALPSFGDERNTFGGDAGDNSFAQYLAGIGGDDGSPASYLRGFGDDPLNRFQQQAWEEISKHVGTGMQPGGSSGPMATLGGEWSGVDQWNDEIAAAASKHGVDPNLIKAIMKLESNGDPNATGAPGVIGLMQINQEAWGVGPWSTDNAANIDKGAEILAGNYRQHGSWDMAIRAYLGFGGPDMFGTDNMEYLDIITNNWNQLNAWGGAVGNMPQFGQGTSGNVSAMFPSGSVPDWGEFNIPSSNGLYGYGTSYGLNGINHTGVDVPMDIGTPYYAPLSGVVTCGGTGIGSGADGGGCAAFGSPMAGGPTSGRVEVLLDNGAVLIFGHSQAAAVRPGQRFNAGALLGYSGGMNSAHIHLEARVRDSGTASGWRIVDPRSVLGGASFSGAPSGGMPGGGLQMGSGGPWWTQSLDAIFGNAPAWGGG